jgi:hypothetical protein
VLRILHGTGKRVGFHALRRYRAAMLRKAQVPEDPITLRLGVASRARLAFFVVNPVLSAMVPVISALFIV